MEKAHGYQKVGIIRPVCGADFHLGLNPIGFIYLPIAAITTVHIPVIVGSYVHGPKGGALLGGIFGLTSLIRCFSTPTPPPPSYWGRGRALVRITLFWFWPSSFCPGAYRPV